MTISLILIILLGPFFALLLYFYVRYKFKTDYTALFTRSYFLGILSVSIPVLIYFILYLQGYTKLSSLRRILFYSFIGVGLAQELSKFIVLRYFVLPKNSFRSPGDGILFSLMINFGSMSLIVLLNCILFPEISPLIILASLLISVVFAVIMGFFVGLDKTAERNQMVDSSTGLLGAAFFHGSYQFILETSDFELMIAFIAGSALITLLLLFKAIDYKRD